MSEAERRSTNDHQRYAQRSSQRSSQPRSSRSSQRRLFHGLTPLQQLAIGAQLQLNMTPQQKAESAEYVERMQGFFDSATEKNSKVAKNTQEENRQILNATQEKNRQILNATQEKNNQTSRDTQEKNNAVMETFMQKMLDYDLMLLNANALPGQVYSNTGEKLQSVPEEDEFDSDDENSGAAGATHAPPFIPENKRASPASKRKRKPSAKKKPRTRDDDLSAEIAGDAEPRGAGDTTLDADADADAPAAAFAEQHVAGTSVDNATAFASGEQGAGENLHTSVDTAATVGNNAAFASAEQHGAGDTSFAAAASSSGDASASVDAAAFAQRGAGENPRGAHAAAAAAAAFGSAASTKQPGALKSNHSAAALGSSHSALKSNRGTTSLSQQRSMQRSAGGRLFPAAEKVAAQRKFKIILTGDGGVGKRTFLKNHFETGQLENDINGGRPGATVNSIKIRTNLGLVHFTVWDPQGNDKFGGLQDSYYKDAHGAIIMFDVTSRITYKNTSLYYRNLQRVCNGIPVALVGNKTDLPHKVKREQITLHENNRGNMEYFDTIAKSNTNCDQPMQWLVRQLLGDDTLTFTPSVVAGAAAGHDGEENRGTANSPRARQQLNQQQRIGPFASPSVMLQQQQLQSGTSMNEQLLEARGVDDDDDEGAQAAGSNQNGTG